MNRRTFCSLPLAGAIPLAAQVASPDANPDADPGAPTAAIERWKDLRFGMFVHWGPVSIVGTEIGWSRAGERRGRHDKATGNVPIEVYDNLYRMFNPVKFNPDQWVQLAKDAGMKYLVFTTRHHDGFTNFDSELTDYKITSEKSPFRKDIVRMLSDACRRGGIDWGVYYSQPDWHNPDYRNGAAHANYIEYLHGQVHELLTNYGPTRMWFFDGLGGKAEDWDALRLIRMMRKLQPDLVINNRAGIPADYDTPEQRIGMFQNARPWETCATVGTQWAYSREGATARRRVNRRRRGDPAFAAALDAGTRRSRQQRPVRQGGLSRPRLRSAVPSRPSRERATAQRRADRARRGDGALSDVPRNPRNVH
jgi:hypothetical protein